MVFALGLQAVQVLCILPKNRPNAFRHTKSALFSSKTCELLFSLMKGHVGRSTHWTDGLFGYLMKCWVVLLFDLFFPDYSANGLQSNCFLFSACCTIIESNGGSVMCVRFLQDQIRTAQRFNTHRLQGTT